jgi:hypothetical protein
VSWVSASQGCLNDSETGISLNNSGIRCFTESVCSFVRCVNESEVSFNQEFYLNRGSCEAMGLWARGICETRQPWGL